MTGKRRPPWSARQYRDEIVSAGDLLSPSCRLVALTLRDEFYRDGRGKISLTKLEELTGLARSTLCLNLAKLEDARLLTRRTPSKAAQLGHGAMTHYTLHVSDGRNSEANAHAANESGHRTSVESGHRNRSVRSSDPLPNEGSTASASVRSRSAPRTSPRDAETETVQHEYKPWQGFPATHARHWDCMYMYTDGFRCASIPPTDDNRHVLTPKMRADWDAFVRQSAPTSPVAAPAPEHMVTPNLNPTTEEANQ